MVINKNFFLWCFLQGTIIFVSLAFYIDYANRYTIEYINSENSYYEKYQSIMDKGYATEYEVNLLRKMEDEHRKDRKVREERYFLTLILFYFFTAFWFFYVVIKA